MEEETKPVSEIKPSGKSSMVRTLLLVLGGIALVGLGAAGVYWTVREKPEWLGIKSQNAASEKEVEDLVKEVGRIIELPKGETPTIATVTELDKVKDQPFFTNAKNGDKVLVYTQAKKAYLYRPSGRRVIEVGVVNIDQQQKTETSNPTENIVPESPTSTLTPSPTYNSPTKSPEVSQSPTSPVE